MCLRFEAHFKQFFDITVQTGALNIRVVQLEYGISFNQTHHITTTIIDKWFPPTTTECIKGVNTPFCTDPQYKHALSEKLSATNE